MGMIESNSFTDPTPGHSVTNDKAHVPAIVERERRETRGLTDQATPVSIAHITRHVLEAIDLRQRLSEV